MLAGWGQVEAVVTATEEGVRAVAVAVAEDREDMGGREAAGEAHLLLFALGEQRQSVRPHQSAPVALGRSRVGVAARAAARQGQDAGGARRVGCLQLRTASCRACAAPGSGLPACGAPRAGEDVVIQQLEAQRERAAVELRVEGVAARVATRPRGLQHVVLTAEGHGR